MRTGVDLTPVSRRNSRRLKGVLRIWGASIIGVFAAVVGSCIFASVAAAGHEATSRQLIEANQKVTTLQKQSNEIRRQLTQLAALQKEALAISDQPDWSILMRLLAGRLDAHSSLRSLKLEKIAAKPPLDAGYELTINGVAPSATAVSALALRLQSLGLFDSVSLVRTMRSGSADVSTVTFDMACSLKQTGGAP
jgi:Tfp pilus assembly protein PilN